MPTQRSCTTLLGAALLLAAGGCSVLEPDKIDYKSSGRGVSLEVPPDLTQLPGQSRYAAQSGAVTASGYQAGQVATAAAGTPTAANKVADVQFMRQDGERWLRVDRAPDQLWGPVRDFWLESGFLMAIDQANMGLMETDWAENRAKIPQDIIRSSIGKLFDGLYSTGERDRFRTRLERNAKGGTNVFISHRGMVEVYSSQQKDATMWQPRPVDPELEAEFLRRMMVKLGVSQEQSKAAAASAQAAPLAATAKVTIVNGVPAIQMDESFDRAWRRVGLSLDRTGFTVEDRNRTEGVYYVRYVAPNANKKEQGFFSKLFSGSPDAVPPLKYRVTVRSEGSQSTVSVLNATGAPEASANAERILRVLADDMK